MKIIITGAHGMLGSAMMYSLSEYELHAPSSSECDITKINDVENIVKLIRPNILIHCAAFTDVNKCELDISNSFKVNAEGTFNVAKICEKYGVKLIAISTDYVFSGESSIPYTEFDYADPKTIYGASKLAGENLIKIACSNYLICRVSWLYGMNGPSFVHTMINLSKENKPEIRVVNDQIGNPTSTLAVVEKIKELLKYPNLTGIFHITCEGEASWYEFSKEIFRILNISQKIIPCTTAEFKSIANRPANSRLEKLQLKINNFNSMPHWKTALEIFLRNRIYF